MNIFVLDIDPTQSAAYMCDKHVVKMILESAQLLCSPFENNTAPYKRTHYNHPCSVWARQTLGNYQWLLEHAYALTDQYWLRYDGREHKSHEVIDWCWQRTGLINFEQTNNNMTPFVQCMTEQYKLKDDPVQAYRNYYVGEKSKFAKWKNGNVPEWWKA